MSYVMQPDNPVSSMDARENNQAFYEALDAVGGDTKDVILCWIEALAKHFMDSGHLAQLPVARKQATEVIAQIIWTRSFAGLIVERVL